MKHRGLQFIFRDLDIIVVDEEQRKLELTLAIKARVVAKNCSR
jgi:hypothetical protein